MDPHLDLRVNAGPENNSISELPVLLISMYTLGLYLTLDLVAALVSKVSWLQFRIKPNLLLGGCLPQDVVSLVREIDLCHAV